MKILRSDNKPMIRIEGPDGKYYQVEQWTPAVVFVMNALGEGMSIEEKKLWEAIDKLFQENF